MDRLTEWLDSAIQSLPPGAGSAIAGALVLAGVLACWRLVRPSPAARNDRLAADRHAVLEDRLGRLLEERAAADARLAERLHAQERTLASALATTLDRRLDATAARLDAALDQNRTASHAALSGLAERLGRIDEAQARLGALSGQ
ncbi:MAG: hypothetical protein RIM80_06995, partial [Alphaproteobacteria bacterium]